MPLWTSKPLKAWIFCFFTVIKEKQAEKRSNKKMIKDARDSRVDAITHQVSEAISFERLQPRKLKGVDPAGRP